MGAYHDKIKASRIGWTPEQISQAKNAQKRARGEARREQRKARALAGYIAAGKSNDDLRRIAKTQGLAFYS